MYSRVVAPGYLKKLYQELIDDENDTKSFPNIPPSPSHLATPTQQATPTPSTVLTLSQYRIHDSTHSCESCSEISRSHSTVTCSILTQSIPTSHDSHMTIRWYIPSSMTKYCVIDEENRVLQRLCLPMTSSDKHNSKLFDEIPVFTPSVGRGTSALLNLTHSGMSEGLHVIVTTMSEMQSYMGAWQGHVIMALPDNEALGKGQWFHYWDRLKCPE